MSHHPILPAELRANLNPLQAYYRTNALPTLAGHLTGDQLALVLPTYRPLLLDPVTGLWNGQMRVHCLRQAIAYAEEYDVPVSYGEGDVVNLGGGNEFLNHTGANERILKPFTSYLAGGLSEMICDYHGSVAEAFRHGGDEVSWFTVGVPYRNPDEPRRKAGLLTEWLDDIVMDIDEYVRRSGLSDLPNGKDKEGPKGTGFIYGLSVWERGMTAEDMMKLADERLCQFKRGRKRKAKDATAVTVTVASA